LNPNQSSLISTTGRIRFLAESKLLTLRVPTFGIICKESKKSSALSITGLGKLQVGRHRPKKRECREVHVLRYLTSKYSDQLFNICSNLGIPYILGTPSRKRPMIRTYIELSSIEIFKVLLRE
jgi:hypothetical protein